MSYNPDLLREYLNALQGIETTVFLANGKGLKGSVVQFSEDCLTFTQREDENGNPLNTTPQLVMYSAIASITPGASAQRKREIKPYNYRNLV